MLIIAMGVSAQAVASELEHPLFRAIKTRNDAQVAFFLRQEIPVTLRTSDGTTPLMVSALYGSVESMQMLLERGANPNVANDRGVTPLLWAATEIDKVRLLLDHGADVNARSSRWNTPLIVAASSPTGDGVVELLLQHGADVTARNRSEKSALMNAVAAGSATSVGALISHARNRGCWEELVGGDADGLWWAAGDSGNLEIVARLFDSLPQLQGDESPAGAWGLNAALSAQHTKLALDLIARGARLDATKRSSTLMLATYSEIDDPTVVLALLDRGADVDHVNRFGDSALTWARRRGHTKMIQALVDAGAPDSPNELPEIPSRSVNFHAGVAQAMLRDATSKSIALLQRSSDEFFQHRNCVSCHHHDLPAVAFGWARDRGLTIDQASVNRLVQRQPKDRGGPRFIQLCYELDRPAPEAARLLSYRLWGNAALGVPLTPENEAIIWYLSALQRPDGSWASGFLRPPMGDGDVLATALVLQSLQLYPLVGREKVFRERIDRAAQWLAEYEPRYHQERVFKLLGLGWAGLATNGLTDLREQLLNDQRDDGGWSQLPELPSDAWATGETLVALHAAGGVPTSSPAYRKGLEFLLNTQFEDGSWFVESRSDAFQAPFESGFPFGKDQWVSAAATAWAVMAMTLAIEPGEVRLPQEIGEDVIPDEVSIAEKEAPTSQNEAASSTVSKVRDVDFVRDVQVILERSCVACHSGDEPSSNLSLTDRDSILQGGDSGVAAMTPGLAEESLLIIAAIGSSDGLAMPPEDDRDKFPALTAEELAVLKKWIDDGATWPEGVKLKKPGY